MKKNKKVRRRKKKERRWKRKKEEEIKRAKELSGRGEKMGRIRKIEEELNNNDNNEIDRIIHTDVDEN